MSSTSLTSGERDRLDRLLRHPASRALHAAAGDVAVHWVGGVVRDALLNRPTADFDGVVESRGRQIAERLADLLPARLVSLGGDRFAAYRLVTERFEIDLWDREGASLESDLRRRDFTLNALALTLPDGELRDPLEGLEDLRARRLRGVSADRFVRDPLRVLRLPRLAATLGGMTADEETIAWARIAAPGLGPVAAERIRSELAACLAADERATAADLLGRVGLFPKLWIHGTDLAEASDPPESPGLTGAERLARRFRSLALHAPRLERRCRFLPGAPDATAAAWALSFRVAAGTEGDAGNYPAALLAAFRDRGWLPIQEARRLAPLVELAPLPTDERPLRRALHALGPEWATALLILAAEREGAESDGADRSAAAPGARDEHSSEAEAAALDLMRRVGRRLLTPPRLLDGAAVQELLGLPPGPEIGRALARVRRAQVEGRIETPAQARELLLAGESEDDDGGSEGGEAVGSRREKPERG